MPTKGKKETVRPHLNSRAESFSPLISRKDKTPFTIPKIYDGSPELNRRALEDVASKSLPNGLGPRVRSVESLTMDRKGCGIIGQITIELWYSEEDEMLLVRLQNVNIMSTPSPSVIGSTWICKPECKLSVIPQRKKFWEALGSKTFSTLTPNSAVYIGIKKQCLHEKSLRLTCYDGKKGNDHIPIGHVFLPLKDLAISSKSYSFCREIMLSSEPTGFSRGKIEATMLWISSADKLEIRLGKAKGLKSPRGVLRRQFYAKISVFVGGDEVRHWKTASAFANPDVAFNETLVVALTGSQLTESTILIYLFAKSLVKLSITSELIGTVTIGPYMSKGIRSLTQWERVLAKPFEEITEDHKLYL